MSFSKASSYKLSLAFCICTSDEENVKLLLKSGELQSYFILNKGVYSFEHFYALLSFE